MYTADDYREQLKALLPPGRALPREPGTTLEQLLDAMAQELARIDGRADQLVDEALPNTTLELLPDWERVAGLPDECSGTLQPTIQGRRNDLVARLTNAGGQSPAYFIAMAAALGFVVTITEFRPLRAGLSHAGDAISNGDWAFTWRINGPLTTVTYFRASTATVGEPLASWGNATFECRMGHLKPAHTILQFAYGP